MQNSLIVLVLTDVHEKVFRFVLLVVVWLRDVRVGMFRVVRRRYMWKLVTASGRSRHDAVRHEARRLVPSLLLPWIGVALPRGSHLCVPQQRHFSCADAGILFSRRSASGCSASPGLPSDALVSRVALLDLGLR
jgi:hypothetical protein